MTPGPSHLACLGPRSSSRSRPARTCRWRAGPLSIGKGVCGGGPIGLINHLAMWGPTHALTHALSPLPGPFALSLERSGLADPFLPLPSLHLTFVHRGRGDPCRWVGVGIGRPLCLLPRGTVNPASFVLRFENDPSLQSRLVGGSLRAAKGGQLGRCTMSDPPMGSSTVYILPIVRSGHYNLVATEWVCSRLLDNKAPHRWR